MKCPYCGYDDTRVIDSRPAEERNEIRRRRECAQCGKRFTTYERIETAPLMVIKKNGSRELFDRSKLEDNIMRACHKRPVSRDDVQNLANTVENKVRSTFDHELTTGEIGDIVLEELLKLDQVAYVRFASVYHDFSDVDTFLTELIHLKELGQ